MASREVLLNHGRLLDQEEKRVECLHCGLVMRSFNHLKHHIGAVGTDVQKCPKAPPDIKEMFRARLMDCKMKKLFREVGDFQLPLVLPKRNSSKAKEKGTMPAPQNRGSAEKMRNRTLSGSAVIREEPDPSDSEGISPLLGETSCSKLGPFMRNVCYDGEQADWIDSGHNAVINLTASIEVLLNHGKPLDLEVKRAECLHCGIDVHGFNCLQHHIGDAGVDVRECPKAPDIKEMFTTRLMDCKMKKLCMEEGDLQQPLVLPKMSSSKANEKALCQPLKTEARLRKREKPCHLVRLLSEKSQILLN